MPFVDRRPLLSRCMMLYNRVKVIVCFAALFFLGTVIALYCVHKSVSTSIRNAYALEWAGDMVIEYMDTNHGQWPKSWDNLREPYVELCKYAVPPCSFDELQATVRVDWNADLDELVRTVPAADVTSLSVVYIEGSTSHWPGADPNQMILDYIKGTKTGRMQYWHNRRGEEKVGKKR